MRLEDIYRLYLLMLEPESEELWEENNELQEGEEKTYLPSEEPYPIAETFQEGDVIELFPSNDGLPMLFAVGEINPAAGEALLVPLSSFIELATPHDVLVEVEGKPYIAQTDLFITAPSDGALFKSIFPDKSPLKVGKLEPNKLKELKAVLKGEKEGVGSMSGGVKKLFKEREAQRYAPLQLQIIKELEALSNFHRALEELKELRVGMAAAQKETSGHSADYTWHYDEEKELLTLFPNPKYIWSLGRIIFKKEGKEIELWNGPLFPKLTFPIPKDLFPGKLIENLIKIVPLS